MKDKRRERVGTEKGEQGKSADEQSKKLKFRISTLIHFNLFSHNSNNKISRKSKWKTKNHILVSRVRVHTNQRQANKRTNEQTNQRTNERTIFCRDHLECFFTSHSLRARSSASSSSSA